MNKLIPVFLSLSFVTSQLIGGADFTAARAIGGGGSEIIKASVADNLGNLYVAGTFGGLANFGGHALSSVGATDAFIAKVDGSGIVQWAVQAGGAGSGETAHAIALSSDGNLVVAGNFVGTSSFGNAPGNTADLTSSGGIAAFLAKYSVTDGSLVWAVNVGDSTEDTSASGLVADSFGNVYVAGTLGGSADFGDGSPVVASGSTDAYMAKYDADGALVMAVKAGGVGTDSGSAVAIDSLGRVLLGGNFSGTVNFPGFSLVSRGLSDVFLARYSSTDGSLDWAVGSGSDQADALNHISTDDFGNSIIVGYFSEYGTATFGGEGIDYTSDGFSDDGFIAKYAADGSFVWGKVVKADDFEVFRPQAISVDSTGNVVIAAEFSGDIVLGGTALSSIGGNDVALASYTSSGNLDWVLQAGGASKDSVSSISMFQAGKATVSGYFSNSITIGTLPALNSAGETDAFSAEITLTGVTGIALDNDLIYENQPSGTEVGTLSSSHTGVTEPFTYTLVAGSGDDANGLFSISADKLLADQIFDFENVPQYSVRVRSTATSGEIFETILNINVGDQESVIPINLSGLSASFDGTPKFVTASADPDIYSAQISLTYDGVAQAPTNAGSYSVSASLSGNDISGYATGILAIAKATPSITWPTPSAIYHGEALGGSQLNATADVAGTFSYSPDAGTILPEGSVQALSVVFTPSDGNNYDTALSTVFIDVLPKTQQSINFSIANQVYGESPIRLSPTSTSGLPVDLTLLSSAQFAEINDLGELVLKSAGDVSIVARQAGNSEFDAAPEVIASFTIEKASASISASNLSQVYDGSPKYATFSTNHTVPEEVFTISVVPKTMVHPDFGVGHSEGYSVDGVEGKSLALVKGKTYKFLSTDFQIHPILLSVTKDPFYNGGTAYSDGVVEDYTEGEFHFTVPDDAPGLLYYSSMLQPSMGGRIYILDGIIGDVTANYNTANQSSVTPVDAGDYSFAATISDPNFYSASTGSFSITKAVGQIVLTNLNATYDGTLKTVSATTNPPGLPLTIEYDVGGSLVTVGATDAGSYPITATINDPNYIGSASGNLVINKAVADVVFSGLSHIYDGTLKTVSATTNPPGLPLTIEYDVGGSLVTVGATNVGSYPVFATVSDPNYLGSLNETMAIFALSANVSILSTTINGQTGLMDQHLRVENLTGQTIEAFRLTFENLKDVRHLLNRTGTDASGNSYVEIPHTLVNGDSVDVFISYMPTVHSVRSAPASITVDEIDINTIWEGAVNLGDEWLKLDWFDIFNASQYPWVYHASHGWLYLLGNDADNLWMWSPQLGWFWTSKGVYPNVYLANDTAWAWLSDSGTLYNYETGQWEEIQR